MRVVLENPAVGDTTTPIETTGHFLSITPTHTAEGMVQLSAAQYTTTQEQMRALEAEDVGRSRKEERYCEEDDDERHNPRSCAD
uniref:Uncharacterized protein n=1 Tax=Cannabis sativa TaxID=3483 RepID=A0A803QDK5_CANSA